MSRSLALIIIFTLIMLGPKAGSAAAYTVTEAELKSASFSIPEGFLKINISSLGDLNFRDLLAELNTVEWKFNSSGVYLAGSGKSRTGAIYLVEQRKVIVNKMAIRKNILPVLAFHEGLGALGYQDEHGELSISAATEFIRRKKYGKSAVAIPSLQMPFLNLNRLFYNEVYKLAGGATSVGGGGDYGTIEAKLFTMLAISEAMQTTQSQKEFLRLDKIMSTVINAEFENETSIFANDVAFTISKGNHVVLIPFAQWQWVMSTEGELHLQKRNELLSKILKHFQVIQ